MNYEKSRREFYEDEIHRIAPQLAELLDAGYTVEVCKSRSGIKYYSYKKKYHVLRRDVNENE